MSFFDDLAKRAEEALENLGNEQIERGANWLRRESDRMFRIAPAPPQVAPPTAIDQITTAAKSVNIFYVALAGIGLLAILISSRSK